MVGNVLNVDESKIRSKSDIDKMRGLTPERIIVKPCHSLTAELRDYLVEVLQPMDRRAPYRRDYMGEFK